MPKLNTKGSHFPKPIILQAVFWYLRNYLSYMDIKELMQKLSIHWLLKGHGLDNSRTYIKVCDKTHQIQ